MRTRSLLSLSLCVLAAGCFESPETEWVQDASSTSAAEDDLGSRAPGTYLVEPPIDEYFETGGYILETAVTNVVSEVGFHGEVEPGVVYGFNLDDRVSNTSDDLRKE